jgi:glycine dehydrogenase subunit 1
LNPSYVPNTDADRQAMLEAIGVASIDDLFTDIPPTVRDPALNLADGEPELTLMRRLNRMASRNASAATHTSFLGGGAYHHFIPSVVNHMLLRGEFYTAYTPYQPEVAQGTLQAIFEFQSYISDLTAMDVTNAGMYDGATSLAEAALMACRLTGRHQVVALDTVSPHLLEVVRTYIAGQGIGLRTVSPDAVDLTDQDATLLVQHPNRFGYLEDVYRLQDQVRAAGALFVACYSPVSLGILAPPGDYDADIAVAEGHVFGTPVSFGGPFLGLFSCKEQFVRQMPGRIAGQTKDADGRTGYVLTLQAREQHIRRERATSNVCTNTALMALGATIHLAALGPQGLREVAEACYHKAHYLRDQIATIPGFDPVDSPLGFFNEFVVRCPVAPSGLLDALAERGFLGGFPVHDAIPNGLQIAVTELHTREELDAFAQALREVTA